MRGGGGGGRGGGPGGGGAEPGRRLSLGGGVQQQGEGRALGIQRLEQGVDGARRLGGGGDGGGAGQEELVRSLQLGSSLRKNNYQQSVSLCHNVYVAVDYVPEQNKAM